MCGSPGCSLDQRPTLGDSYSLGSSKCREYYPCGGVPSDHYDHPSPGVLMQLPSTTLHFGVPPPYPGGENRPSSADGESGTDYGRPHERATPTNTFMGGFPPPPSVIGRSGIWFMVHRVLVLRIRDDLDLFFDKQGWFGSLDR